MKAQQSITIISLLMLLFASACHQQKPEPKSYLPEEKMIEMLTDVHMAEAALMNSQNEGLNADSLSIQFYAGLFHKHGVSRDRYEKSLKHYMENPELMEQIYEKVYNRLVAIQTEIHTKYNIIGPEPYE